MIIKLLDHQIAVDPDDPSGTSLKTNKSYQEFPSKSFAQTKKRVRFDTTKNVEYSPPNFIAESCKNNWYSDDDIHCFKMIVKNVSHDITVRESCNHAPYSYLTVMNGMVDACARANRDSDENILTDCEMIHLQHWVECHSCRFGLEKWSIRKLSRDTATRRMAIRQTVINVQHRMKLVAHDNQEQQEGTEEVIRRSCENISRPSRVFALTWARALANVVQNRGTI